MKAFHAWRHSRLLLTGSLRSHAHPRTPCLRRRLHGSSRPDPTDTAKETAVQALQDAYHHAATWSHAVFEFVHDHTSLPWALSIPLTAIIFRFCYTGITNLLQRPDQKNLALYQPLMIAWKDRLRKEARLRYPPSDPNNLHVAENWVATEYKEVRKRYGARAKPGITKGLLLNAGFIPFWILNLDTLRRMAGQENTLSAHFLGAGEKLDQSIVPPEPSFATEGMLWFPDLTLFDPLYVPLPAAVACLMYCNWWYTLGKGEKERKQIMASSPQSSEEYRVARLLNILSTVVHGLAWASGPILALNQTPSGVCLYIAASAGYMLAHRSIMKRVLGSRNPIPITRPILPEVKTGISQAVKNSEASSAELQPILKLPERSKPSDVAKIPSAKRLR